MEPLPNKHFGVLGFRIPLRLRVIDMIEMWEIYGTDCVFAVAAAKTEAVESYAKLRSDCLLDARDDAVIDEERPSTGNKWPVAPSISKEAGKKRPRKKKAGGAKAGKAAPAVVKKTSKKKRGNKLRLQAKKRGLRLHEVDVDEDLLLSGEEEANNLGENPASSAGGSAASSSCAAPVEKAAGKKNHTKHSAAGPKSGKQKKPANPKTGKQKKPANPKTGKQTTKTVPKKSANKKAEVKKSDKKSKEPPPRKKK